MQRGHGLSVAEQLICRLFQHGKAVRRIFSRAETVHHTLKINAQVFMHVIVLQHSIRHTAGYQAGQVDAAKKLIFIGLFGKQPFKLPRTGDPLAEQVDGQTLGLTGLSENEQVIPRQQRNGDQLNQLFTLRHLTVDILHYGQHFISQCHTIVTSSFVSLFPWHRSISFWHWCISKPPICAFRSGRCIFFASQRYACVRLIPRSVQYASKT